MGNDLVKRSGIVSYIGREFFKDSKRYDDFLKYLYSMKSAGIESPCSVGDTLYLFKDGVINNVQELKVVSVAVQEGSGSVLVSGEGGNVLIPFKALGNTVFLSKEEITQEQNKLYTTLLDTLSDVLGSE